MKRRLLATLAGVVLMLGLMAAPAAAQQVDIGDFTDPVTGEVDLEAYFAALAAGEDAGTGAGGEVTGLLARTGADVGELAAIGLALVTVGSVFVVARRRRGGVAETGPTDAVG